MKHLTRARVILLGLIVLTGWATAAVTRVEIISRGDILQGKSFGTHGAYEWLSGRLYFEFDPDSPANAVITDLRYAPRNSRGRVTAWADFQVLQPKSPEKRAGIGLVEVSNRGGKFSLRYFNYGTGTLKPTTAEDFGDGLLMDKGLTVIWLGWQYDVPPREGLLRLHVPRARKPDRAISGLVRSDWTVDTPTTTLALGHRDHLAYPVVDAASPDNVLTVRDGREAERHIVPRSKWTFARQDSHGAVPSRTHIYMATGFRAGKIYELVYRAEDPAVVGLGLAAIRDVMAWARHDSTCPCPVTRGIAVGVSQTGRFLRHFLYQGFNTDENDRPVYDGFLIITAGAGRGSFNHRFAQPSRDGHRYSAFFYPTDLFPFSGQPQRDPLTGWQDGLLTHAGKPDRQPRIFFVNTGYEYWGRAASLIHTSPDGRTDVTPGPNERIYHLAGGQHFVGPYPPKASARIAGTPGWQGNPLDFSVNYRALLVRLVDWVARDRTPPPSTIPLIRNGTLVPVNRYRFPAIPGITAPKVVHTAYRVDYGPRWKTEGIVTHQPPVLGRAFPALVCQTDTLGNEAAGIRNVELTVPLATYTPWNLRRGFAGGNGELTDFLGTYIPLPATESVRRSTGDPRPSIASLYTGRTDFMQKVRTAASRLVAAGFLLPGDVERVCRRASRQWDDLNTN